MLVVSAMHWWWVLIAAIVAVAAVLIAHAVIYKIIGKIAQRTRHNFDDALIRHSCAPTRALAPLLALWAVVRLSQLPAAFTGPVSHLLVLCCIGVAAWIAVAMADVFQDVVKERYNVTVADNLTARRVQTQIQVLRRIFVVIVVIVTGSIMLMTFPAMRRLGETVFASAGIAGLVVGLAARSTLSSLLAGIQIALTQPIRIDDVLIVEGEWGRVEEIQTTYVIVRIWDERRLVVPLSYFIEKPFQNWTRSTSQLLGTVFLYADYTVPIEALRQELFRCLQASELWDRRVWVLQVTDAKEHTLELRALMSAADASKAWDLRCYVREQLITFIQTNYPQSLPRFRTELHRVPSGVGASERSEVF